MRWVFGLIGTLFTFSAGAAPPVCDQFQKERRLVNELYAELAYVESMQAGPGWSFRAPAMESILDAPLGSACWLVRELVVTHRTELDPMQSLLSHPVWAIRTLRYITNCGDFRTTLPEKEWPEHRRAPRWNFLLLKGKSHVPYFSTWMSRDTTMIAPVDVQRKVISQWQNWYANEAAMFKFSECEDDNKWYF